ncbi:MAG: hypothetical protein P8Y23_16960 [Candidatus Lokiarchaeota archaeon]
MTKGVIRYILCYWPLSLKREIVNFLYDKKLNVDLDDGIRALEIALKIVNC